MNYRFIAVEGNIGAGKSTLANLLAKQYQARLVLEEFADNNFLPKFYNEPERYAFPLELSFLADRYKQLKGLLPGPELFRQTIVSDYIFTKSKLFAKVNLKEDEYELFQKLFDIVDPHLPPPDILIYLHCPVTWLQQRIKERGRSYEQQIPDEYLSRVEAVYQQYLRQETCPTVIVDMTRTDFILHPADFQRLTTLLDSGERFRQHYL